MVGAGDVWGVGVVVVGGGVDAAVAAVTAVVAAVHFGGGAGRIGWEGMM